MHKHLFFGGHRAIGNKQQFRYEVGQEEHKSVKDEAQTDDPQMNVPGRVVHVEVFLSTGWSRMKTSLKRDRHSLHKQKLPTLFCMSQRLLASSYVTNG